MKGACTHFTRFLDDCYHGDYNGHGLRLTVHKPVKGGSELEQVIEYVGDQRCGKPSAGRRFPSQSGIIGEAFRNCETVVGDRIKPDYENYVKELVGKWHYVEKEARTRNPASMSWLAIPLVSEGEPKSVAGVVYADSTLPGFFDEDKVYVAQVSCAGIARFVESRYK